MPSVQATALFSAAEIGVLSCSKCSRPMRLACIEPVKPGFDLRTFECTKCNSSERFLVKV
jgi:hypothetical protein